MTTIPIIEDLIQNRKLAIYFENEDICEIDLENKWSIICLCLRHCTNTSQPPISYTDLRYSGITNRIHYVIDNMYTSVRNDLNDDFHTSVSNYVRLQQLGYILISIEQLCNTNI